MPQEEKAKPKGFIWGGKKKQNKKCKTDIIKSYVNTGHKDLRRFVIQSFAQAGSTLVSGQATGV